MAECQWDRRFAIIMEETERSLAKVKSQLRSPVSAKRAPLSKSPVRGHQRRTKLFHSPPMLGGLSGEENSRTHSSSLATLQLSSRIEEQQKELHSLRDISTSLQSTVHEQNLQIRILKDEVLHLQKRLSETGVDLRTERKLEEFKSEVSHELDLLRRRQQQQHRHDFSDPSLEDTLTSIAHEVHSSKRLWNEDMDSLLRDISLLKSRMVNQESEVVTWSSGIRDLERRLEKLTRMLLSLQDWQRSEQRGKRQGECTTQLHNMRKMVTTFEQRLNSLEQRVLLELSYHPSGHNVFQTKTPGTERDTTSLLSLSADLDHQELHSDSHQELHSDSEGDLSDSLLLEELDSISSSFEDT